MPPSIRFAFQSIIMLVSCLPALVFAVNPDDFSIEQLMNMKVTTPNRSEQSFSDTASAVFVITENDIRRSGVTSIPDALRLAPGINVAQITSSKWAISARGFNSRFANKLLVLVDGRAVYNPDFNGVYWEAQDMVLEDIDRIEVLRGSGASLWGTNAVNGVINIITKHTEETQGGLVSALAGSEDQGIVSLRYGDAINSQTHFRVYSKYSNRDGLVDEQDNDAHDSWEVSRGGFRLDWHSLAGTERFKIQGDYYAQDAHINLNIPNAVSFTPTRDKGEMSGGHILMRFEHDFSLSSRVSAQLYYDHYQRNDLFQNTLRDAVDFEFKHEVALSADNTLVWGGGYRFSHDEGLQSSVATLRPDQQEKDLHLYSLFFQDRQQFFEGDVELSFGTRVQHYNFGGWQFEPNIKALWKLHPEHRLWVSLSRSIRRISRVEDAIIFNPIRLFPTLPFSFVLTGNNQLDPEEQYSAELGYRFWPLKELSVDMTVFYNDYDNIVAPQPGAVNLATLQVPLIFSNAEQGETWGFELATDWRPLDSTRLQLSYSYLHSNFTRTAANTSPVPFGLGDNRNPHHQLSIRLSQDIARDIHTDLWLRYTSAIDEAFTSLPNIVRSVDHYWQLDARIAWTPLKQLELSLAGRNLLNNSQLEFYEEFGTFPTQVQRSVYGQIRYQFEF